MQEETTKQLPVELDDQRSRKVTEEAISRGERGLNSSRGQEAIAAARIVITRQSEFTTDDVWQELGQVPQKHDEASFMGSVMRYLSQNGEIVKTGNLRVSLRPQQHRKNLTVWRSATFNPWKVIEAFIYWRMIEEPELQKLGTIQEVALKVANHPTGEMYHFWNMYDWLKERGLLPDGEK